MNPNLIGTYRWLRKERLARHRIGLDAHRTMVDSARLQPVCPLGFRLSVLRLNAADRAYRDVAGRASRLEVYA